MRADDGDVALQTLLLPFADGSLTWPGEGGALFLRARDGWPLHQRRWPGLVCEQTFKPEAEALERSGLPLASSDDSTRYPLVLVLPPRQREEARALFARAVARCAPGGRVVACLGNNEGAKSGEADLARIAGPVSSNSKHKCRVFWTAPLQGPADGALMQEWLLADEPRPILDGRFVSRPGVFAWDRIDAASRLLAEHLPTDLAGRAADLGAGYGYLASELLARCPRISALDLFEAESRALDLARTNLAAFADRVALDFHWHDVTRGLDQRFDVIVSNPPFHAQGRADRPDIGRRFIAVAAQALNPGGRLWLVANRHLPYESELGAHFGQVRTVAERDGFKAIEAVRATASPPLKQAAR
ncbi:class I SAM-dependent methyltransferase [Lysobacter niastensis]|uniref:Class I SAM-dependent methyltransferase n=1 Tax=Lysobacter niastensis TaxID=380629 RepID=A0ABS0B6N7_9GAMM|nr:class I SAM-dependent methyltransferase [Lysobacter niastensis]MBF6023913.1 class I SAM-dependent methyltransferase [Lysobacter niastensis]